MLTIKHGKTIWVLPALLVVSMMLLSACGGQAAPAADGTAPAQSSGTAAPVSFQKDILPILQSRCVKCHGGAKTEKGLNVTDYPHLMAGAGADGPVIVASDAAKSKLIQMVQSGKMPKMSAKLLPDQIQKLVDWVNQGALNN